MAKTSCHSYVQWFGAALLAAALLLTTGAGAAHAADSGPLSLADTIARSSAVVVASIRNIDERAGLQRKPNAGGLTKITLLVEQVLHGAAVKGERELWLPVGVLPDGTITGNSNVPKLTQGDLYIMFLSEAKARLPIVSAPHGLLRIVSFPEKQVVVDQMGHGILASREHGLLHLRKIAESLLGRYVARASETEPGLEYTSQAKLAMQDVRLASKLDDVLRLIADVARTRAQGAATLQPTTVPDGIDSSNGPGVLNAE